MATVSVRDIVDAAIGRRTRRGRAMPDGTLPRPAGWNRFSIEVSDLAGTIERLRASGARFRNEIVTGVGGRQILVEGPSGNPSSCSSQPRQRPGCSSYKTPGRCVDPGVVRS